MPPRSRLRAGKPPRRAPRGTVSTAPSNRSRRGTTPTRSSRRSRPTAASTSIRSSRTPISWSWLDGRSTASGSRRETCSTAAICLPREGKCQHAFCIDVDRGGDVRVLANVVPGQYWMDTMLHELGHATFDLGFDAVAPLAPPQLPPRRHRGHRDHDGAGSRATPSGWSGSSVPTRAGRRDRRRAPCRPGCRVARLHPLGARDDELRALAVCRPGIRSRRSLVGARRALSARRSSPPVARSPDWAAKIHVACAPVYYHTYLYGQHRRLTARSDPAARVRRARRPACGRQAPHRARVRPGALGSLGSR